MLRLHKECLAININYLYELCKYDYRLIKLLKFRKCYAASLNLTFRFISLTMSSSSSMMALRTSGA